MQDTNAESTTPPNGSNTRRWLTAGVGVLAVVLGGIGVVVPGLPTTIFLILASWCFTRSCPWLEQRLLRNRFFAPYMRYLDGEAAMSWRGKALSIALMWLFVSLSSLTMLRADRGLAWLAACIVLLGVIGTVFIIRWRPRRVAEPVPQPAVETPEGPSA
jgi:uncharacterized membrane protein YbaN (DUF454 family)